MMLALAFLLAIAKDVHVVIKGSSTHIPIGGTIVTATIDTLSVFPGVGVDTITVALCDMRGEVLESHSVLQTLTTTFSSFRPPCLMAAILRCAMTRA